MHLGHLEKNDICDITELYYKYNYNHADNSKLTPEVQIFRAPRRHLRPIPQLLQLLPCTQWLRYRPWVELSQKSSLEKSSITES